MSSSTLDIALPSLEKLASGKVRDLFLIPSHPDRLLFVASDRISAYDVILASPIPRKGQLLTQLSAHWFHVLPELVPGGLKTHFITLDLPGAETLLTPPERALALNRSMQVRKLRVLPLEVIVRGYLTGSAWKEYQARGTVHSIPQPAGLRQCEHFPAGPLYTPSTKADAGSGAHDENIHPDEAAKLLEDVAGSGDAAASLAAQVERVALATYAAASAYAAERGVIIADTKFEFGLDGATNELVLVDEVLTPDSSRFWDKETYEVGREQESFDKQFLRDWLVASGLKGKDAVEVPGDVAEATAQRYEDVFRRLTGRTVEEALGRK